LVIGVNDKLPVYLKQVARVQDGPSTPKSYVSFGYGKTNELFKNAQSEYPAVTISISKIKGADAMKIADKILKKLNT